MNCHECENLIGDFLDGALAHEDQSLLSAHLEKCLSCAGLHNELRMIVMVAHNEREHLVAPPNAQALWLRIRDVVEIDDYPPAQTPELARGAERGVTANKSLANESLWSRLWNKRWELSLPQMTAALASLVVAVALITALGLQTVRNFGGANDPTAIAGSNGFANGSNGQTIAATRFGVDDLLRQQQADIEYWNQRIEQRRARWSPQMRETFQRTIAVVDQAVDESINELRANPGDEASSEMLNVALENKTELMRQFAEF